MNIPYPTVHLGSAFIIVGTLLAAAFFLSLPGNSASGEYIKNWALTKCEKAILIIIGILGLAFTFTPPDVINDWESVILIIVLFPLGLLFFMDSERRKN